MPWFCIAKMIINKYNPCLVNSHFWSIVIIFHLIYIYSWIMASTIRKTKILIHPSIFAKNLLTHLIVFHILSTLE